MFRKLDPGPFVPKAVAITIDGVRTVVEEGEPIAAVLLRVPPYTARLTPVRGLPRAPYCMMGACFDCMVEVDGRSSTRSCLTRARDGMAVRRQPGRPDPLGAVEA